MTQRESESSGQYWGNARDGCPLFLCHQCGLARLPAPADLLAAPSSQVWGLTRAVPGTMLFLGQSLQEAARSPSLRDLWTLENLK